MLKTIHQTGPNTNIVLYGPSVISVIYCHSMSSVSHYLLPYGHNKNQVLVLFHCSWFEEWMTLLKFCHHLPRLTFNRIRHFQRNNTYHYIKILNTENTRNNNEDNSINVLLNVFSSYCYYFKSH